MAMLDLEEALKPARAMPATRDSEKRNMCTCISVINVCKIELCETTCVENIMLIRHLAGTVLLRFLRSERYQGDVVAHTTLSLLAELTH